MYMTINKLQVVILPIGFPNWRVSGMYIVEVVSMMEDCKYSVKIHRFDCCNSSGKSLVQLWAHPAIQSFFNFVSSRDLHSHKQIYNPGTLRLVSVDY